MTATADRVAVARLLSRTAADLERLGFLHAGIVRHGAQLLLEAPQVDGEGCAGCGAELAQPATGRRRKWCSEACRRRHRP